MYINKKNMDQKSVIKKLKYYEDLDKKGKVIHEYIFEEHISATILFYEIIGEMPEDYKFKKTEKRQTRNITKYNYESNFQRKYCGSLARKYKKIVGHNPPKFKKYRKKINQEKKEDFVRDEVEDILQEEAINMEDDKFNIADKSKSTGGSCMYPIKFTDKDGNTVLIMDIARQLLRENPPSKWKESITNKNQKEKIKCECGREVQRAGMTKHKETPTHKRLMEIKV